MTVIELDSLAEEPLKSLLSTIHEQAGKPYVEKSSYAALRKTAAMKALLAASAEEQCNIFGLGVRFVIAAQTFEGTHSGGNPWLEIAHGVLLRELAKKDKLGVECLADFIMTMASHGGFVHQFFPVAVVLDRVANEDLDLPKEVVQRAKQSIDVYHLDEKPEGVSGMGFDGSTNTGTRLGLWLRRRGVEGRLLRGHGNANVHRILDAANQALSDPALLPLAELMALAAKPKAGRSELSAAKSAAQAVPSAPIVGLLTMIDEVLSSEPKLYRFESIRPVVIGTVWVGALMEHPSVEEALGRLVSTCREHKIKAVLTAAEIG